MDVIEYTARMLARDDGTSCGICGRAVRPGQYVLRMRNGPAIARSRYLHINPCLRAKVEATPAIDPAAATTVDVVLDQLRRDHEASLAAQ